MNRREHNFHEPRAAQDVPAGSSDRGFGLVFAGFFAVIALWPLTGGAPPRLWALGLAVGFAVAALTLPRALAPLNRLWTRFGLLLGRVANPVVMGLLFFLVLTPMALVMRLGGKRFLQTRLDRTAKSYWIAREPPGPAPESLKNQF